MKDIQTINKVRTLDYVAKSFATGVTDLTLVIRRPNGSSFPTVTFSEQSGGVYTASYTPDTLGVWQEKITSVTNGDKVITGYQVVSYDDTDNQANITTVSGKVDSVQTTVNDIQSKVNDIHSEVSTGGYVL